MLSYNFSKLISDGGDDVWASSAIRNWYCRSCDRSLSVYDQRHRLVGNFTYELPFGRGKRLGAGWNKAVDAVLGGWQANGIVVIGSALPLQFSVVQNTSFSFGGNQRPDSTGVDARIPSDQRTLGRWFDTAQFRQPEQYTFGTLGRVHPTLRADRVENVDFSIFKNYSFGERAQLQFRGEAFNLLNHVIFGAPNAQVGALAFGQVTSQANSPRQVQLALKLRF
jgi:hypothetical protein